MVQTYVGSNPIGQLVGGGLMGTSARRFDSDPPNCMRWLRSGLPRWPVTSEHARSNRVHRVVALSSSGRTADFQSANRGSIPRRVNEGEYSVIGSGPGCRLGASGLRRFEPPVAHCSLRSCERCYSECPQIVREWGTEKSRRQGGLHQYGDPDASWRSLVLCG